jgi:ABC-type multidrug transport system fused ATPase/permease subunit
MKFWKCSPTSAPSETRIAADVQGEVVFDHVSFGYDSAEPTLQDIA